MMMTKNSSKIRNHIFFNAILDCGLERVTSETRLCIRLLNEIKMFLKFDYNL